MSTSSGQTDQSRIALYETEQKWIDASIDLYNFALNNFSAISVRQNRLMIADQVTQDALDHKLRRAVELHREFWGLRSSTIKSR